MKRFFISVCAVGFITVSAYAHVTVKPAEVKPSTYQTFTVSVPVEKEIPTTALRLLIPAGIQSVMPNVKPGWKIEMKKETIDGEEKVIEVIWSAGSIPVGQRDEFMFSAKTPIEKGSISWKAYQTYRDGSVVSWDVENVGHDDQMVENTGPASITNVVEAAGSQGSGAVKCAAFWVSVVALLVSLYALYLVRTGKRQ